jgi:hypothetical protein
MMHYFPKPYPDELLYSIIARYCIQSGNTNVIYSSEDIFGRDNRCFAISPELPGNIDLLVSNIPNSTELTSNYFICNSTLFPYIASFLPEEGAREVYNIMKAGQTSVIYNKAGLVSGSIKSNRMFRFCPKCIDEDIKAYGEAYWHRSHQVTGVFICPIHKEPTYDSDIPYRGNYRMNYIAASKDVCKVELDINYKTEVAEKLFWIAEDIYEILNRPFEYQSLAKKKFLYMEHLIEKKIANMISMVHQKRLRKELIDFWGTEVLEMLQSPIEESRECNWLNILTWEKKNISLPIRHILLMRFLGIKIDDFSVAIPDNITHKEIWDEKLVELANKKTSITKMAIMLDSTKKTVRNQMLKMGIEPYWNSNTDESFDTNYSESIECKQKLEKAKEEWQEIQSVNPNLSRNQLRKLKPALYNRLVKYDRQWLLSHSKDWGEIQSNLDWVQRDNELLIQVQAVVYSMHTGRPEHVQWHSVGGRLGINGWFGKNRDRLPLVKEYLDNHIETLSEFHLRRIAWAIKELEFENEVITPNKLLEKAGVKPWYLDDIYEDIKELLKTKGYNDFFD